MPLLEFKEEETFFHKLSPAMKSLWGCIVIGWVFVMFNPLYVLAIGIILLLVGMIGANIPLRKMLKTALLIGGGSIFILLFQGFFYPGDTVIFEKWILRPTVEGFYIGTAITLRILSITTATKIIAKTTDPRDIFLSLVDAGVPYRIAHGFFTAIRFIPMMEHEAQTIQEAQMVRGITKPGEGLRAWFNKLKNLIVPLIAAGLRRAEQSGVALEVRCFGMSEERTYIRELDFNKRGWAFVLLWLGAFVAYVILTKGNLYGIVNTNPLAQ